MPYPDPPEHLVIQCFKCRAKHLDETAVEINSPPDFIGSSPRRHAWYCGPCWFELTAERDLMHDPRLGLETR